MTRAFSGTERYAVERVLGEGRFGVVYQCVDRQRDSRVALKMLRALDPTSLGQLKTEFRVPARIVHPNVALLHELESDGARWFITMEFVDGVDLTTRLRSTPAGSPERIAAARPLMAQLARAVHALHLGDTLHRDLKPNNVLVTHEDRVVVVDFGLSANITDNPDDSMVGSATYMAPETADRATPDAPADWYSFGVLLYQAVSDRLPFEGRSMAVLMDKCTRDAPPLHRIVPDAPAGLDALCAALLARDPAQRPSGADIVEACEREDWRLPQRAHPRGSTLSAVRARELVGRDAELDALRAARAELEAGRSGLVRITGASGVGKSALVRRFVTQCQDEGRTTVFEARCYERESVPFKALDGLVDAIVRDLSARPAAFVSSVVPRRAASLCRLFPALQSLEPIARAVAAEPDVAAEPGALRRDASLAFQDLLDALATERPLVVVLDDLQWGDTESASLLSQYLRRARSVLLVACDRGDDPLPCRFHEALVADGRLPFAPRCLHLAPLTDAHCAALAAALLPPSEVERAAAVARESHGNPFLLGEFARLVRDGHDPGGLTLDALWRSRFDDLSPGAWSLLVSVAVAAQPISEPLALRASSLRDGDRVAVRTLLAARLLREAGTGSDALVTWHDRVRDAVVSRLDAPTLAARHRDLATTFEHDGRAEPETLAVHHQCAGNLSAAVRYLTLAAERASRALAFERAAELLRRALTLGVSAPADARTLHASLAEALSNSGRGPDAAREYLAACDGAAADVSLRWRLRAADALIRSGHLDAGLPLLREIMGTVGLAMPRTPALAVASLTRRRAGLWWRGLEVRTTPGRAVSDAALMRLDTAWTVASALGVLDVVRAADVQSRHLAMALDTGEPFRVARSLAVEAASVASAGESGAARADVLWGRARAIAAGEDNPTATGIITALEALGTWCMGRWRSSLERAVRALSVLKSRCTGVSWELAQTHIIELDSLVYLGCWDKAAARAASVHADASDRGDLYLGTITDLRFNSRAALADDDPARAERCLESVARWTNPEFDSVRLLHSNERIALALYRAEPERALVQAARVEQEVKRSFLLQVQLFRIVWLTGRATAHAMAAGQRRGGARADQLALADVWIRKLGRERSGWAQANAAALTACTLALRGDLARAERALGAVSDSYESLGMALHAASARRQRAKLRLEGTREPDEVFAARGVKNAARAAQMIVPLEE